MQTTPLSTARQTLAANRHVMARGLGANPELLSEHWINIAKQNGALE